MEKVIFEKMYREMLPFWNDITEEERTYLRSNSTAAKYAKGTNIHNGSECSGVILVRSGCLRVYILSDKGKEVTLYRVYDGDLCMLSASDVLKSITFDVHVDAEENSECFVISGQAYASVSDNNPQMKIFNLELTVSRFSKVMWIMQQILFMSMDKRIAAFLYNESSRLGSDMIQLTHEQIARYVGTAREVVTRMLRYFLNEGIVEVLRNGVRIADMERLKQLMM